jgi:xylulokinase
VPAAATLGIDLGTGSTKAALAGPDGQVIAERGAAHPAEPEVDVSAWWASVVSAVRAVVAEADVEVAGVGLSGQMHGVVLLDRRLQPLAPALTWADARSPETVADVSELARPYLSDLANPVVAGMAAVSLRWLRRRRPDLLDAARYVVQPKDWLGARLTGVAATDPTDASATLLWDLPAGRWHTALLDALQLDPAMCVPVLPSDAIRGPLLGPAAGELGLPADLPVTVGRGDTPAALIGSGVAAWPEYAQLSVGTGGQICRIVARPMADPTRRTHLYCGPGAGQWYAMAATLSAGLALEWVRGVLGVSWRQFYAEAFSRLPGAGRVVFHPYLAGERTPHMDTELAAAWSGLRLQHQRADLLRAALEGSAFALRDAWDALVDAGNGAAGFVLAGGGTADARWRQLLSDVLQRRLLATPAGGGSARGAALSAAVAAGWFDGIATASATAGEPRTVTEPAAFAPYEDALHRFRVSRGHGSG